MSSAVYPLGMKSMPSSGYTHQSTYYNKQYISWKGTGINSYPTGIATGHIRPLTNNDPGNIFQTGFGLPRPIKHYRKGRVIQHFNNDDNLSINENALINYNLNRFVKSSKGTSLGGGSGGFGLLNEMQDKPGGYIVKLNAPNQDLQTDCDTCQGVGIIASYSPNLTNLSQTPEPNTTNSVWCCNQEKNAKRRVMYASTNLKKNYYTTTKQYLQNRCKTYDQKAFNFLPQRSNSSGSTPGSSLNTYLANCQLNAYLYESSENAFISKLIGIMLNENIITQGEIMAFNEMGINSIKTFFNWIQGLPEPQKGPALVVFEVFINNPYSGMPLSGPSNPKGCQLTVYKPNNYQYAKQGAVSSSTRLLNLNVNTISNNAASIVTANKLYAGDSNDVSNLLKNKAPSCNTPRPLNMNQSGQFQNKKFCFFTPLHI